MPNCVRCGILLGTMAVAALSQTFIEHANVTAPAAAGSTAGAVVGTKLNQALGVLGQAAENGGKVEAKKTPLKKPEGVPAPAAVAARNGEPSNIAPPPAIFGGSGGGSGSGRAVASQIIGPVAPVEKPVEQKVVLPPVRSALEPVRTREQVLADLARITPGVSRSEVIDKLGAPAYRITFDDGGRMVERMRFRVGREDLGVVELKDGVVNTARPLVH